MRLCRTAPGGRIEAVVSPVGASLQGLVVDGLALVRGDPRGPVSASGAVLVPWPNRIRDARWMLDGGMQQLDVTEPSAGNALHGLVAAATFSVTRSDTSSVELFRRVSVSAGYPFELDVTVCYRLVADGIRSTITIVNLSKRLAPVAVGVHPYLSLGDTPKSAIRVQVDGESTLLLGDDNLPLSLLPVDGSPYDLRAPTAMESAPAHAAYTGLRVREGRIGLRLDDGGHGRTARLWADQRFRWAQLYVTGEFPGLRPGEAAIALEPMTAPPDAFNSGVDLQWLSPLETWSLGWGIDRL